MTEIEYEILRLVCSIGQITMLFFIFVDPKSPIILALAGCFAIVKVWIPNSAYPILDTVAAFCGVGLLYLAFTQAGILR